MTASRESDLAEGTEPLAADVKLRVRAALRYLETERPGKRYAALLAVWRAATDLEGFADWRPTDARRTYRSIPLSLKVALAMALKLLEQDPHPHTVSSARLAGTRLRELADVKRAKPKVMRTKQRSVGTQSQPGCSYCKELGHNKRSCIKRLRCEYPPKATSDGTTGCTDSSPDGSEGSDG